MTLDQTNKESTITPVKKRLESLLRSTDRIQRQIKMMEQDGARQPLIATLHREAWINLKRSWALYWAVRKLKA